MRLVICGGGTGGHLFPGIAVAQEWRRRFAESEILFIGTGRRLDRAALRDRGLEIATIHCGALKGGGLGRGLKTLCGLPGAMLAAARLLRRFKPAMVFGVGGYVTGPVLAAARLLGVPACIHEQNSVPGLANRALAPLVKRIYLSIPGSERFFPAAKCRLTGNPLRREIVDAARSPAERAASHTLLVLGGSLGAHRLNVLVPEALSRSVGRLPADFRVIHQSGPADEEMVRAAYAKAGIPARVTAFIEAMAPVYGEAGLALCRAGATTIAELTAVGLGAVLVPYPFAADDHQRLNGAFLVEGGAARMRLESELTAADLAAEIGELMADGPARAEMGRRMRELARPAAAADIVEDCLSLVDAGGS